MIKIIGGYKESEIMPLNIIVEYKDLYWLLYRDHDSDFIYGDLEPYKSLEELEIVPNVEVDEDTKMKVLSMLLKNKENIDRNIRTYILDETYDPITREWIKPEK